MLMQAEPVYLAYEAIDKRSRTERQRQRQKKAEQLEEKAVTDQKK